MSGPHRFVWAIDLAALAHKQSFRHTIPTFFFTFPPRSLFLNLTRQVLSLLNEVCDCVRLAQELRRI
jgi:hypothetical protein